VRTAKKRAIPEEDSVPLAAPSPAKKTKATASSAAKDVAASAAVPATEFRSIAYGNFQTHTQFCMQFFEKA
jgi:hypothetical protein